MPRWTRETRLLVVTVLLSVSVLLALARLRFPGGEPGEPIRLPARPLQQLAERASFDDLAATVERVEARVRPTLAVVLLVAHDGPPRSVTIDDLLEAPGSMAGGHRALAIHIGDGRFVVLSGDASREEPDDERLKVVARDPVRGLMIVSRAAEVPPMLATSQPSLPSFLVLAEPTPAGVAMRPVFGPAPDTVSDPRWPVPLVALGPAIAAPGTLLFSLEGAFVGAIVPGPGGPALAPADTVLTMAAAAAERGDQPPATLGVRVQRLDGRLAAALGAASGVLVAAVDADGPASNLLLPGDVVRALGSDQVRTPEDLLLRVAAAPAATRFDLDVLRSGTPLHVEITSAATLPRDLDGKASVAPGPGFQLRAGTHGVVVAAVAPGSAAANAGLRPGDEIWWLQGTRSVTPRSIAEAWRGLPAGGRLAIGIRPSAPIVTVLEKR